MTDTPDFDKMSPEEIMKWMESLAVRQGATEGLTTSADMDIGSVSEDDERLKNTGEYIPYGMKKEDWEKQKAREDEQKRQRMAAQPPRPAQSPTPAQAPTSAQSAPPPPPVQQPAPATAQPAAASDTPDFDNMSPDEIMRWMESLAKRQGAVEGFTTSADADVADVSADDERLKGKGEYIPFGMKQADWDKQLAKEEEQRRARQSQPPPAAAAKPIQAQPPAASFMPPTPQPPAASIQPPSALDDFLSGDLPGLEIEEEETVQAGSRSHPVDWLSNVVNKPDEFDFDSLNNEIASDDDPFAALANFANNDTDDSWLTSLGDDSGLGSLADLANFDTANDPLEGLEFLNQPAATTQPTVNTVGPQPGEDSLEWLESMARDHGASSEELMTPANLNVTRPNETRTDGPGYKPYSFETTNDVPEDAVPVSADLDFLNEDEGSPEDWLDDVARGVATGEMPSVKVPSNRTPEPVSAPKDDDVADDVMARLSQGHDVDADDINKMFESFFERAEQFKDRDEDFNEPKSVAASASEEFPDEALKAEIPDWLRDQMITSTPDAEASPDASKMDALMNMFDEEAARSEDFTAQPEMEESGAMPDWLRQTPEDDIPALTSSEVPAIEGDGELPDWLQVTDGEESDENIFAETPLEDDDLGELILDSDDFETDEEPGQDRAFALDHDPWVVALTLEEEASDELSQWYAEKTGSMDSNELADMMEASIAQPMPAAAAQSAMPAGLKAAQLPIEAVLMLGEPQAAPDWLIGTATLPAAVAPSYPEPAAISARDEEDIPDWLRQDTDMATESAGSSEMDDIPDWLRDQVDDSVTADASDLPPWLASEEASDVEGDDIPDWLRETMAEEEAASAPPTFTSAPTAPTVLISTQNIPTAVPSIPTPAPMPVPMQAAIQPVKSSPAPMTVVNIDVASTLQAARGKVSSGDLDGSLADYELIVRANTSLDEVVKDLSKLAEHKDYKRNPSVYRVLGDTLMRRGELKIALETYRKALHML